MLKKCVFTFLALLSLTLGAAAELRIDVTEGTFKPVPIAITPFDGGGDPALAKVAEDITQVVRNDLESCGLFKVVDPNAHIQSARDVMTHPRFPDWKILNAEALVGGLLKRNGSNFQVDFRLFDVFTESQLTGLSLGTEPENWRRVAHKIADEIYERITGDKGYFDTRIVYVAVSNPDSATNVKYRLAIMDQDGENHQYLSSGNTDVGTPRVSPCGTKVAYVDYGLHKKDLPSLRVFDLNSGRSESIGTVDGQRMSPRFSPNGDHIILSSSKGGATSLYKMDLGSKKLERLTSSTAAIDVSPCYNPEGTQLVYCSDRGGKPQIYVKPAGGGEGSRISFGQGAYYTPVWSPRGDLIAFTRQNGGTFYIGVMRPDGSGERMIDSGYLVEGPTWSPNGREVLYVCQDSSRGKKGLCSIDIVGFNKRKLNIPDQAHEVTW
ncbi:MAG: Tol-Pal system protein TolB [Proteobacteria bacterium]|nr:Tol-Pal system protein TolB [Pseudomonadota bacterium]